MRAAGGLLALFGAANGWGTLAITAGATLFLGGAVAAGYTADFLGTGATLDLFAPSSGFAGTLENFTWGDALDIGFASVDAATWAAGTLTLKAAGAAVETIAIAGRYAGQTFGVRPDGAGGALVMLACFAAGTRIATPAGARAVETLRPGDAVLTPRGPRRLRWAGRRRGDARDASELRPVRIAADALGPGQPSRDLLLSASHAVLLAGRLVPAIALLHGAAVRREAAGWRGLLPSRARHPRHRFRRGRRGGDVHARPGGAGLRRRVGNAPPPRPAPRARGWKAGRELEALRATLFGPGAGVRPSRARCSAM